MRRDQYFEQYFPALKNVPIMTCALFHLPCLSKLLRLLIYNRLCMAKCVGRSRAKERVLCVFCAGCPETTSATGLAQVCRNNAIISLWQVAACHRPVRCSSMPCAGVVDSANRSSGMRPDPLCCCPAGDRYDPLQPRQDSGARPPGTLAALVSSMQTELPADRTAIIIS